MLFQEKDVLSSNERIRQDCLRVNYGLGFVIKFLNIVCVGTIDCIF